MKSLTLDRFSWPTRVLLLAALYFVTGKLGLLLAVPPGYATAVWPPSGIALGGLLVLGMRCWPGVWLGSFCVNLGMSFNPASFSAIVTSAVIAGSIGLGAALEAVLGAALIRKFVGWPPALLAGADVFRFMAISGLLSSLTNATWSVTLLWLAGVVPGASLLVNWTTWWIGDTIGSSLFSVLCLVAAGEPREIWRQRWLTVALPLAGAFAAVVAVFFHSSSVESRERRADFMGRAILQAELLQQDAEQKELLLRAVASRFESAQRLNRVSRQQFQSFTRPLLEGASGIRALEWVPRVPRAERAAMEKAVRDSGLGEFSFTELNASGRLVAAGDRQEYYPVVYSEPYSTNPLVLGFDLASESARRQALNRAGDTGRPAATGPVMLVRDTVPGTGLLLMVPVYSERTPESQMEKPGERDAVPSIESRRERLRGFAVGIFQVKNFVDQALRIVKRQGIDLWIEDEALSGRQTLIYHPPGARQPPHDPPAGLEFTDTLTMGERNWRLHFLPTIEYLTARQSWGLWLVLVTGLALTCLLCTGLLIITGHTAAVEAIVTARTRELAQTEAMFQGLFEYAPDAVLSVDHTGVMLRANAQAERLFGYQREELLGQPIELLLPERFRQRHVGHRGGYAADPRRRPMGQSLDLFGRRKDGTEFPLEIVLSPMTTEQGDLVIAVVHDITDRKRTEDAIRASLEEKETLLREVHHRVKNNMQVISSILHLQSDQIRDPADRAIFDECQNRVRSMAMVHEKLYRSPNLASIDFGEHIRELAAMLSHFYSQIARHARLEVMADPVRLDIETAIPLGLIVNELISNSLKHAFPGGRSGTIQVSLRFQSSGKLLLAVQDDGVGLPDGFDLDKAHSLGLKMIRDLIRQVGGTLNLFRQNGTTFEITLPSPVFAESEE